MLLKRTVKKGTCSAGELAWQLELLCRWGIWLRTNGHCAGREGDRAVRRIHDRHGHDNGCYALGLPVSLAKAKLAEWDGVDAQGLLLEAFEEAITEIASEASRLGHWQPVAANEAIMYAIRRRITPRQTPQRRPQQLVLPRPPPSDCALGNQELRTRGSPRNRSLQDAASSE